MNWRRVKGAVCHVIGMRSSCGGTNVRNALVPQASLMKGSERGKREREKTTDALLVQRDGRGAVLHVWLGCCLVRVGSRTINVQAMPQTGNPGP